mmetsp:Transcript_6978/g.14293  ORF Transcript_6978/g.14293 Transcript_6978/m.14293 type:complete len:407 (+) Transcript_6978:400-1620(+)
MTFFRLRNAPLALFLAAVTMKSCNGFAVQSVPSSTTFGTTTFGTTTTLRVSHHSSENDKSPNTDQKADERRMREFVNLEPLDEPDIRRRRLEEDDRVRSQFVSFGDELWDLRNEADELSIKLLNAISEGKDTKEQETREKLRQAEQKDPELVYMLEITGHEEAKKDGRTIDSQMHYDRAMEARNCLPQFNLEGLWVGKYGSHGYELINVTYVDDTLIATKVTGDKNVPRGEITFQADLNPMRHLEQANKKKHTFKGPFLQPIELTEKAARKWGTRQLPRYMGLGQVAEEGFVNHQWMEGQLIIIGEDYFSFAWTPIQQQIFFGRPSPELALKMLRESGVSPLRTAKTWDTPPSSNDDVQTQMEFVARCFEVSDEVQEETMEIGETTGIDGYGCIFSPDDSEECHFE